MASLDASVKKKFQFVDPYLDAEEKAIMNKYADFNKAASIPFFAQALRSSTVATPDQKNQINEDKLKAWFTAMSSLKAPEGGKPDPVIEAGLKRDDNLKKLQDAYSAQMDDLYKLYYKRKVADFDQYCPDEATAKEWFDRLKDYIESPPFQAQWASLVRFHFVFHLLLLRPHLFVPHRMPVLITKTVPAKSWRLLSS